MLRHLYRTAFAVEIVPLRKGYNRITKVESVLDGQLVQKSDVQFFDSVEYLRQFDCNDFSIANLVAVGSYKEQNVIVSPASDMTFVDNFAKSVSSIKKSVNHENTQAQTS